MQVTILGKRFRFEFTHNLPKDADGICDDPTSKKKRIAIRKGLSEQKTLEIVIHETLHAANWHAAEEWIDESAKDIARILWKLGYRRSAVDDESA